MNALAWGLGAACVGVAGALLASFYYIFPRVGAVFVLISYVAVALGGFGSIGGALLAGVMIGVLQVVSGFIASTLKSSPSTSYLAVVLFRPTVSWPAMSIAGACLAPPVRADSVHDGLLVLLLAVLAAVLFLTGRPFELA